MRAVLRLRTAPIARELYWLACDTIETAARGLVNLSGWDWFRSPEAHADHSRAGPKCGFWNLECERLTGGGFEFWGFGQYLMVCRAS